MPAEPVATPTRRSPWTFRVLIPSLSFPCFARPLDPAAALCRRISGLSALKILTMSGSRTAVPVTAAVPPTSPLSTPTAETATRSSRASDDAGSAQEHWWSEEDLAGASAERCGMRQERANKSGQPVNGALL